ncbi:hypothetical protein TNCV_1875061 [Trichonephila clavipes]|nr:hypothetical protein TNCV_1875061 [Trichonephila clavipes]
MFELSTDLACIAALHDSIKSNRYRYAVPFELSSNRGSLVVKITDSWPACHEFESLKTRCVEERCTENLPRSETSSNGCGVVVRRVRFQLRCRPRHLTMVQNYKCVYVPENNRNFYEADFANTGGF